MTTVSFDKIPTDAEKTSVDEISKESAQQAWQAYGAKAEHKEFNKHDLIESMLPDDKKKSD